MGTLTNILIKMELPFCVTTLQGVLRAGVLVDRSSEICIGSYFVSQVYFGSLLENSVSNWHDQDTRDRRIGQLKLWLSCLSVQKADCVQKIMCMSRVAHIFMHRVQSKLVVFIHDLSAQCSCLEQVRRNHTFSILILLYRGMAGESTCSLGCQLQNILQLE